MAGLTHFSPFEISTAHLTYVLLGAYIAVFMMVSLFIKEKLYIGEAVTSTIFGIIIGPYAGGLVDPRKFGGENGNNADDEEVNELILEVTRIVLALGVFAIGVELPRRYIKRHWKSLFFMLCPVMAFGWVISAALIYALIPGLDYIGSLTIAATLTPTDPILAAAVIGGKFADEHIPSHIKHVVACESGCNDGAAFPFLYIGIYLLLSPMDTPYAVEEWFLVTWLYEVALGIFLGSLIGYCARKLMKLCEGRNLIDRQSFVAQYVSLTLLCIGIALILGSDDLLASFCCGTAFSWDGFFNKATEESNFSSMIDLLFNSVCFIFIGTLMPFDQFNDSTLGGITNWRLVIAALCIFIIKRIPPLLALYRWIPDVKTFREALFIGYFGPIGVGAVFIGAIASVQLPHPEGAPQNQAEMVAVTIQPIVFFLVICSTFVHGLSIPFFSLSRRVGTTLGNSSASLDELDKETQVVSGRNVNSWVEGNNVVTERPLNNNSYENDIDVQVHTVGDLEGSDGDGTHIKHNRVGGTVGPEYEALKRAEYEAKLKEDVERAATGKKKVVLHVHHKPGTRDWINSKLFGRAKRRESESENSSENANADSGNSSPMKPSESIE
ncbi:hypothetical protein E3P77_03956 [Wallemia ichthyophaga]|uniref:Cation/H+ exchanger transmembrane domain-containing protein n=2 Tax=Wallemia ichthyophaga TaxID=245174 RepID=A0A4T0E4M4_WALIC|nr:putative Na(+)/H(+) antiporter C3A11.09 [Wallemia ichthyophaga EXF-994]TIA68728.1 hypothetical protein E3P91_03949 [Wallemia ichthyophaga]EOQ98698.1 putative Na(+)/H(+) antiporter C3A11.09 [Wallemia ichthyophaga EXF-994]TIA87465.1 hypothetical protein E3P97_03933 [Wallemia ichthyophaga]TIB07328.1 hypothetical protein E3P93_03884 [Wallemia ichthyophaga]TIB07845.1 hypothetical protein E3P90_03887 [Wallemia ichthyophaga]